MDDADAMRYLMPKAENGNAEVTRHPAFVIGILEGVRRERDSECFFGEYTD
jgi:hypothetical protein